MTDVATALTLGHDNPQIGSFDALLLAVAVRTGAEAVVSEDAGGARPTSDDRAQRLRA